MRGEFEKANSLFGLIAILALLASLLSSARTFNAPVFLLASQLLLMLVYTLACGRDFSFMGFVVITFLTQTAITLLAVVFGLADAAWTTPAILASAAVCVYIGYDLAMIMKRRRPDETTSSIADFYRDLLNVFAYPLRVVDHWRQYRFDLYH